MSQAWDQVAIQEYIDEEREESLTLDYKAAGSLAKSDGKKAEITKDVSAMANSAGGIILYGVAEHTDPAKKHLAEKIDPIDRRQFPKEWLEHIISNIRPHVDGLIIHPVPISGSSNNVVYVVEIPQGSTAHQATDKRYYKRFNFESVPMEDYEIRDIMNRVQHPKIELDFAIEITKTSGNRMFLPHEAPKTEYTLLVRAKNTGKIYAQYVNATIHIPRELGYLPDVVDEVEGEIKEKFLKKMSTKFRRENTVRDVLEYGIGGMGEKYGPSRFAPILPGLSQKWEISITNKFETIEAEGLEIVWSVYADNAPESSGRAPVKAMRIIDRRDD